MDSEEAIRHAAITDLERAIGPHSALYIMSTLPVVNWHELATKDDSKHVATKDDLQHVATKDDLRVFGAELRMEIHQSFEAHTRWMVGYMTTLSAVVLTVAKLWLA